ncbi:hypothetical protein AAG906_039185 [Vitis piasezkii]
MEGGLLTRLAPRPVPQPVPPRFRMDLHYQGLVNLGQPSVTMNPLPAHSTYVVPPPSNGIHHIDFVENDNIHMMSWDDGLPEPIVLNDGYEIDAVGSQTSTPFSLISDWIVTHSGRVAQLPFLVARPFDGAVSHKEVRREDDELLRQLQNHHYFEVVDSYDDGRQGHIVPSVMLDNGSVLNICPLATTIALGYAPSNFSPSTQTVRAHESTKREVMGTLMIELLFGPTTFPILFQVFRIPTSFNLLLGRPWIHRVGAIPSPLHQNTLEVEDFCNDFVAMSFDQHSSTIFIATIDHDAPFGFGFVPAERERVRACLTCTPFDYLIHLHKMSLADYFDRGLEVHPHMRDFGVVTDIEGLGDETSGTLVLVMIVPLSPDRANFLSLCFPEETIDCGVDVEPTGMIDGVVPHDDYQDEMDMMSMSQITEKVQPESASPFDLFRVSAIEIAEEIQTVLAPELMEDVAVGDDLFEDTFRSIEEAFDIGFISCPDDVYDFALMDLSVFEYLPVSCDSICIFAFQSLIPQILDIDDEIAQPDSNRDSFDHDSDPIDERVSPAIGDVETVDFGIEDQPKELKIGSPLSTDERDRLIHLLISYLDVKEDIQKHLSLANVVLVPKKDGKVKVFVDFRDLNKAIPKDDFLLPHIDLLVDSTAGHLMLFFMDGFSGYNQILMALEDMKKTTFIVENVEVYVDDMIVKSRGRVDHLATLERFFERIHKFRLRLNPKKCTFGVTFGKLLGHMVSERGIKVDPDKIKAILDMLLPLLLHLSISGVALGCMLAQLDDLGKERAIYYLSKRMLEYEMRYVMIERLCLVSVWATSRLRYYMTECSVCLISWLDPLRYLFDKPALTGRLMRWLVLLTKFDIQYISQKSIKGSIVADHLASLPIYEDRPVDDDFPDEEFIAMTSLSGWCMYFGGAANHSGFGIVEYEACILGLETALELNIRHMEVFAQNHFADALATLTSSVDFSTDVVIRPLLIELRFGTYPKDATAKDRRALTQLATRFVICGETLYRRSTDGMLLLFHAGVCCPHMGGHMLDKIMRTVWGIDIIGKISPKSSSGHEFILVAIDYFTKWVEAASYARLTSARVPNFIISHIIYCYGVDTLLQKYGVRHHRSSTYKPQTNGAVEATNKNIKKILRKMVETSRDW